MTAAVAVRESALAIGRSIVAVVVASVLSGLIGLAAPVAGRSWSETWNRGVARMRDWAS